MARSKVKSRPRHKDAQLHPLTNVPTKYQLPTPYDFGQTFSRHPPAHPPTMGENNTLITLRGCGVKTDCSFMLGQITHKSLNKNILINVNTRDLNMKQQIRRVQQGIFCSRFVSLVSKWVHTVQHLQRNMWITQTIIKNQGSSP